MGALAGVCVSRRDGIVLVPSFDELVKVPGVVDERRGTDATPRSESEPGVAGHRKGGTEPVKTNDERDDGMGSVLEFLAELWALNQALGRVSELTKARLRVTAPQRLALRLAGNYQWIAPGRLARLLCMDAPTFDETIRRLEADGLIRKERADSAGRRVVLTLTERARRLDVSDPASLEGALTSALRGATDDEVALVRRFLQTLRKEIGRRVGTSPKPGTSRMPKRERLRIAKT